jgi:uncharacterized protein YcnI
MGTRKRFALVLGAGFIVAPALASAHVEIASGPGFANTTQEIAFNVGHGCSGLDTKSVRIEIPPSVTSVRPATSDFGAATVEKDATGVVTAVTWQKPDVLAQDNNFYKLILRAKVPNAPFTKVLFPAHQTCADPDGGTKVVDWVAAVGDANSEPAPGLIVVPARHPGWNKVTVPVAVPDLSVFFSDAVIVWKDNAAYSANPDTAALIPTTPDVTPLTSLAANDVVWVRY